MSDQSQDAQPQTEMLGALSTRVLIKTVIKAAIWFGVAWLITLFMPGAMWPWYVAWSFVAIGLLFSLSSLVLAFISRHQESGSGSDHVG